MLQVHMIVLVCEGTPWHKSKKLKLPQNVVITFIPPYTAKMKPIKQIWKEIREIDFHNRCFSPLEKVVEKLCETSSLLSLELVKNVTLRRCFWVRRIKCNSPT